MRDLYATSNERLSFICINDAANSPNIEKFQNNFHRLVKKTINNVFFMTAAKNVSAYIWNLVSKGQKALRILLIMLLSCYSRFPSNITPFSSLEAAMYKIPNQQSNRSKVGKGQARRCSTLKQLSSIIKTDDKLYPPSTSMNFQQDNYLLSKKQSNISEIKYWEIWHG